MAYAVDDAAMWADAKTAEAPQWIQKAAKEKIDWLRTLPNPRKAGGKFMGRWLYPFGKFQLLCRIDDTAQTVFVLKIVQIP